MSKYKERSQIYAAAYAILMKEGKVFLLRRFNTDWRSGWFNLPAGHIEMNEMPSHAAIREAHEEAGIVIDSKNLRFAHTMFRYTVDSKRTYADYFFVADDWQGEPYVAEPDKSDAGQWFDLKELPENIIPYLKQALLNYGRGEAFSEYIEDHAG